jgi:hypothetical protein
MLTYLLFRVKKLRLLDTVLRGMRMR